MCIFCMVCGCFYRLAYAICKENGTCRMVRAHCSGQKRTPHLESGLCSFLFIEKQLWNTERLHPVNVLNVVEPLSQAYVSVDALAHPQRKRPVLTFEQYHRNMRQAVIHIVLWRQPCHHRFVVCQQTHRAFRARWHAMLPYFAFENYVVL